MTAEQSFDWIRPKGRRNFNQLISDYDLEAVAYRGVRRGTGNGRTYLEFHLDEALDAGSTMLLVGLVAQFFPRLRIGDHTASGSTLTIDVELAPTLEEVEEVEQTRRDEAIAEARRIAAEDQLRRQREDEQRAQAEASRVREWEAAQQRARAQQEESARRQARLEEQSVANRIAAERAEHERRLQHERDENARYLAEYPIYEGGVSEWNGEVFVEELQEVLLHVKSGSKGKAVAR